jgi:hypothetical protein
MRFVFYRAGSLAPEDPPAENEPGGCACGKGGCG